MHRSSSRIIAICLAALVLVACTNDPGSSPSPIEYRMDKCNHCGNVISEARFAGQYTLSGGTVKKFDDPGCLVQSLGGETSRPSAIHLHDYEGTEWLDATQAWLARTPRIASPQGYGWAAYASFGAAQEAVTGAGNGELLRFEDAKTKIAQTPRG